MSVEVKLDGRVEWLPFEEFERRVRDGHVPPETLIRLPVLTGRRFVPVGEMEFYHSLADVDHQRFRQALTTAGFPVVTAALIGLQIRTYLWAKAPGVSDFLVSHFTNWVPATLERGEVYRILSYGFLHLSYAHLALNVTFLGFTGWNLERGLGRRNLLAVFLFSVFCGGLLSMLMSPGRPSLGASGGDFGLLAACVVFGWKYEELIPTSARMYFNWSVLLYLVVLLVLGWASPSVDNWGHLGGLLGGAALVTWLQPEAYRRYHQHNRRVRQAALLSALVICAALIFRGPSLVPLDSVPERLGLSSDRPSYWIQGWSVVGDQAWISPVGEARFVSRTGTDRPTSPEAAAAAFLLQVRSRAHDAELLSSEAAVVDSWHARRVTIRYRDKGADQLLEALIIPHGAYLHRVYFHTRADRWRRYQPLAERLFDTVEVTDPGELAEARARESANPRSFKASYERGRVAALAGYPPEAEDAFTRAYRLARTEARRERAAQALMTLYADYVMDRADRIDTLVLAHPGSVDVLVAAARAYAAQGMLEDAARILEDTERDFPGDFAVTRARQDLHLPATVAAPGLPEGEASP
jgi:membrane associated rhomboid family serine protease